MSTGYVTKALERYNREHTKRWELESTKLPPLPRPSRKATSLEEADVVLGDRAGQARTLKDAVAKVKPGGVIFVTSGQHDSGGPVETKKPFTLVGAGPESAVIVMRIASRDDALTLKGKADWRIVGLALVVAPDRKGKNVGVDLVLVTDGARLEMSACVVAGAPAEEKKGVSSGGVGVRAHEGGKVHIADSLLAFNNWNAAAHGGNAELTLSACTLFGAQFGLFAGPAATTRMTGGEARRNAYGIKIYGDGAQLEAKEVRVDDSSFAGVYLEKGRALLERCTIVDNNGHGVGAEAGTTLVARGCKLRDNWLSGISSDGDTTLDANEVSGSAEHGIELTGAARGKVTRNRCTHNGGFGIAREATVKVTLEANVTSGNDRGGEYLFGTLAKALQKGFPRGEVVPEALAKLARYQEDHGRLVGETMYVSPGPLAGWPGLEQEFACFGSGPDGSTIAFWLRDGRHVDRAPIVYLDSEGVTNLVLAETFEGLLSILAAGRDDLQWDERLKPHIDDEDEHEAFCEWIEEEFGIEPAKKISKLRKAAEAKHPGLHERLISTLGRKKR